MYPEECKDALPECPDWAKSGEWLLSLGGLPQLWGGGGAGGLQASAQCTSAQAGPGAVRVGAGGLAGSDEGGRREEGEAPKLEAVARVPPAAD